MTESKDRDLTPEQKAYLAEFEDYMSGVSSESKVTKYTGYISDLLEFTGKLPEDLNDKDYRRLIREKVAEGNRIRTLELNRSGMSEFVDFMYMEKDVELPSTEDVDIQKFKAKVPESIERKPLTSEELRKVMDAAGSVRNTLIVKLLYHCATRNSELRNIKLDDINRDNRIIEIRRGKNNKSRKVPYPDGLDMHFDIWLDQREAYNKASESEYLFPTNYSEKISLRQLCNIVVRTGEKAGVQGILGERSDGTKLRKVTPHTFRHTAATHLHDRGKGLAYIKEFLGHESVETTMKYVGVPTQDVLDECREALKLTSR
jgi:integrase/recombinase XerD